jgi:hypothetical protein
LRTLLLYLHPVAALATIALAGWTASLGLRSRLPLRDAQTMRRQHRALGPWILALMVANWAGGLIAVRLMRPELGLATSGHFPVGTAIVVLLSVAALLSRHIDRDPRVRVVHPIVGAVTLLLCGVQVFLGLQLLP